MMENVGFAAAWCPLTLASCSVPAANKMWLHCLDLDKIDWGGTSFISIYPGKGDTGGNGVSRRFFGECKVDLVPFCLSSVQCTTCAVVGLCWLAAVPLAGHCHGGPV